MTRIAGILLVGLLAGPLALAQQAQPPAAGKQDDKKLGGVLQDVNLHDLTVAVQRLTKKTLLWTEDLGLRNKRVHFVSDKSLADDPELLFKAYQSILQVSDLVLIPAGEKGEEIYKIKPSPTAGKVGGVPLERDKLTTPEDRFITRIFALQFVQPRNVQAALINLATFPQNVLAIEEAGIIIATDFDFNIRRFEEIVKTLDVKKPDVELKLIPLKFAVAQDIEQMMNGLVQTLVGRPSQPRVPGVPGAPGTESVKVVADKRTNAVVLLAEPNRLPQLEEIVRRLDSETQFETSGIYVSHLRHTNALDIARTLNAMYRISIDDKGVPSGGSFGGQATRPGQAVAPPGSAVQPPGTGSSSGFGGGYGSNQLTGSEPTIVADIRSNSVIMVTDRNTYKTLDVIIRRLDQRRPQVLIKATVVEIRAEDNFDLGVELNYLQDPKNRLIGGLRSTFGQTSIAPDVTNNVFNIVPVDTPGITLLTMKDRIGNIGTMLKALEGKAKVSILDEPEAATNDNGVATMKVTSQVPVLQETVTGTGIAQRTFSRFETAETVLSISPHISEGGYLRLETSVKIEKFTQESSNAAIPPPKSSREITTKEIMVPSGGSMVIGGIVSADLSETYQGVPFLADIPLLGFLFQRNQESKKRVTLYIFLTPYILYDYGFGDFRDLTRDRKSDIERIRGEVLKRLTVDLKSDKLPESSFRYQTPRVARKEEEK